MSPEHGLQMHMMVMSHMTYFSGPLVNVVCSYFVVWAQPVLPSRMRCRSSCGRSHCLRSKELQLHTALHTQLQMQMYMWTWPFCHVPRWTNQRYRKILTKIRTFYIVIYLNYFITLLSVIICRFVRVFVALLCFGYDALCNFNWTQKVCQPRRTNRQESSAIYWIESKPIWMHRFVLAK